MLLPLLASLLLWQSFYNKPGTSNNVRTQHYKDTLLLSLLNSCAGVRASLKSYAHFAVMNQRVRTNRLHHATMVVPVCNLFFYLRVWPVLTAHNLEVKFGYRQMVRGTKSYYAHCGFQLSSLELVMETFGMEFVSAKPWGEQPSLPIVSVPCKWWDGGQLQLVVDGSCPMTVRVCNSYGNC